MRNARAESEIDHFHDCLRFVQKDVFKLNISVSDISLVAKVNSLNDLGPQELGLKFRHLSIGLHLEVPVKTASIHVLHDDEHLLVRFKCLVELRNIGVVELLHNFHFSFYRLATAWLDQLLLVVDLDCDFLVQKLVKPKSDHGVGALPDTFADDVAVQVLDGASARAKFKVFLCRRTVLFVDLSFVQRMLF